MEGLYNNMARKGSSFDSDPSIRRKKPPNPRGTGQLVQDIGSSFASKSSKDTQKPSALNATGKQRVKRGSPKDVVQILSDDEDDDELDCLSNAVASEDELMKEPPQSFSCNSTDPEHQRSRSEVIKTLKFTRKKSENSNAIPNKPREPTSGVLELKSPNLSNNVSLPPSKTLAKSASQPRAASSRKPSGATTGNRNRKTVVEIETSSGDGEESETMPARQVKKGKGKQKEKVDPEPLSRKDRSKPKSIPVKKPSSPTYASALFNPPVGKQQPAPAAFPVAVSPDTTPKKTPKPQPKLQPQPFPVSFSPENAPTPKANPPFAAFPLSPNVSPKTTKKVSERSGKKSTRQDSSKEELDQDRSRDARAYSKKKSIDVRVTSPFPLLAKAGPSRKLTGKRASSRFLDEDDSPSKKRRREDALSSPLQGLSDDEEDDYFYDPSVDAKTLCPYCDEPLPPFPTPHLKHLLATTVKKSVRNPRPTNPMGRKAEVTVFINVCQRHRFESEILPEAQAKGWPKTIEWSLIHERVMNMKDHLRALTENSIVVSPKSNSRFDEEGDEEGDDDDDDDSPWEIPGKSRNMKRARDGCVFWQEAMNDVKEKGTCAAGNVKNQFANFDKTQPGYYGELGSVIIHQTLFELFPPEDIQPEVVSPLSPKDFINRVLLPEVAIQLIMEDKSLSGSSGSRRALKILRDSTAYGVAMFPEDTGEASNGGSSKNQTRGQRRNGKGKNKYQSDVEDDMDNDLSVADRMARDKARRRRLELEKEEEQEEEEAMQQKQAKTKKRKGKKESLEPSVQVSSPQRPKPKPRPKPKAIQKTLDTVSVDAEESSPDFAEDVLGSDHYMSMDDLDELPMDDPMAEVAAFFDTFQTRSPVPESYSKPTSAASSADSAIAISSTADSGSDGPKRRTRKKMRNASVMGSPGIEMVSPYPNSRSAVPPSSSFNTDLTPKSSASSTSTSSRTEEVESRTSRLAPSASWNDELGISPLEFLNRRSTKNDAGPANSSKANAPTNDRRAVNNTVTGQRRQNSKGSSSFQRTESLESNSWLLDEDEE